MSKHTPGPWYAFWNENFWQINTLSDEFQNMAVGDVCESSEIYDKNHKPHDHAEANANLIAAAPDLFEALERCTTLLRIKRHACEDSGVCRILDSHISQARSAIAKAKGEQHE